MLKRKNNHAVKGVQNSRRPAGKSVKPKNRAGAAAFHHFEQCKKIGENPAANGKAEHTAGSIAEAEKRLQNGHSNGPTPAPSQPTVDLTETIKTLLHLAQEHGYVTYDDINDVLPENLSPDDLDALAFQAPQPRC